MKRNQKGEIITALVIASVIAITAGVTILANVLSSSKQTIQTKAQAVNECGDRLSADGVTCTVLNEDINLDNPNDPNACISKYSPTAYSSFTEMCVPQSQFNYLYGQNRLLCCKPLSPTAAPTAIPNTDFSCSGTWAKSKNISKPCTEYDAGWYGNCRLKADLYGDGENTRRCCDDTTAIKNGARGEFGGCTTDPGKYVGEDVAGQPVQPTPTTPRVKLACQYDGDPTCNLCNVNPNFTYKGQSYSLQPPTKCDNYCRTQYTLSESELTGSRCPLLSEAENRQRQPAPTTKVLNCTLADQSGCELCQSGNALTTFSYGGGDYTWVGGSRAYCANWCAQDGNVTKDGIPNSHCTNAFKNAEAAKKGVIDPNQVVKYTCGPGPNEGPDCKKCNYPENSRNTQNYIVQWTTRAGCPAGKNPGRIGPTIINLQNSALIRFFPEKPIGTPFCELEDNPIIFTGEFLHTCKAAGCQNDEKNCKAIKCKGADEFYSLIPGSCK